LFAWSEGQSLPADIEAIELHVSECAVCQNTLHERDALDPLLALLRATSQLDLAFDAEPTLIGTLEHAKRLTLDDRHAFEASESNAASPAEEFNRGDVSLDYLAPPVMPGSIGRMGRYHVLDVVGSGGMGIVLRAYEPNLDRIVALKVLKAPFENEAAVRQRFLREARAVSSLQHPNICSIYEVGEYEGRLFLAIEHVEDGNLAQKLAGVPHPPRIAAQLLETLARAMHHVHESGIVHRDLKPANVMMRAAGGDTSHEDSFLTPHRVPQRPSGPDANRCLTEFRPLITDFGLAKSLANDTTQTRVDIILGTPSYMAPEQAGGKFGPIGPAVDIYALGAILYEIVTGRPPFRGETSLETVQKVLVDDPPSLLRLQPRLPRDLATICMNCLHKDPAWRYATAQALADDLRRFLDGKPILARRAGPAERLAKWAKRRPAVAALGALSAFAVVVLAVSAVVVNRERESARNDRTLALLRESELKSQRYAADMSLALRCWEVGDVHRLTDILAHHVPRSNQEDLRGFEWYYLRRLGDSTADVLHGHEGEVYAAAVSPDGKALATGGQDCRIVLWNVSDRSVTTAWRVHDDCVNTASFSPDGQRLVTASCDKTVKVWDVVSVSQTPALTIQVGVRSGASFSPDGRTIASWGETGGVRLWDAVTGAHLAVLGDLDRINSVAFSPDSKRLAAARHDGGGLLWDLESKQRISKLRDPDGNPFHSVAFSHDGQKIAGGSWEGTVRIYDASGESIASWQALPGRVDSLAFSADDQLLCVSGSNAVARLWDIRSGKLRCVFPGHGGQVWKSLVSRDSDWIATVSSDHMVRIWSPNEVAAYRPLSVTTPDISSLMFTSQGRLVACGSERDSKSITIWAPEFGQSLCELKPGDSQFIVACSLDLNTLARGRGDGTIQLFDIPTGAERAVVHGQPAPVLELAFSPDGGTIAGFVGDEVLLWNARTGQLKAGLENQPAYVATLGFSPDGNTLLTAAHEINLWDPVTGRLKHKLGMHADRAECAAFSADGTVLATGALNGSVKLWNLTNGTERATLLGHQGSVTSLSFSPDGKTLASGGADKMIRLWRVRDGRELLALEGHSSPVQHVAFSPDGNTLASACDSHDGPGEILLWSADAGSQGPDRRNRVR
jgi:WD40 repeat protein/serine/threonine protein kinase